MTYRLLFSIGYKRNANVETDTRKVVSSKRYASLRFTLEEAEAEAAKISAAKKGFFVKVCKEGELSPLAAYYEGKKLYTNYYSFEPTALTKEESVRTAEDHNAYCKRMAKWGAKQNLIDTSKI